MSDLEDIRRETGNALACATNGEAIEAVRVRTLGKSGSITALLKTLGGLSPDERRVRAPAIQALRDEIAAAIADKKDALETAALDARLQAEKVDVSLTPDPVEAGAIHPVSQVMDELAEIFADLGFCVASGPEIEDEWHNFTALNMPDTHPARTMHDTFYFPTAHDKDDHGRMLLRTHTSPLQIRTMRDTPPPLRIIAPGRVYRADSDATHTPMFHQIEGLVIDRDVHMGHLRWTLETFLRAFFETDDIVLRFRPSYFPFTEPSVEIDIGCSWSQGRLSVGGSESWLEVLGGGMTHPRVIAACDLDPDVWQGFAFGTGVDRLAMLKYGMTDLRAFFDADLRWLRHYGFRALDIPTLSGGIGA